MRFSRIILRVAAAAVAATLAVTAGGAPASAAPTAATASGTSTWTLVDLGQRLCASPTDPRMLYFFVALEGTWSRPITTDYVGMPEGTVVNPARAAEPGSADGHHIQIWSTFRLHDVAVGAYTVELRASDGVVTQSTPVALNIQTYC
ncbi:MAG: DUF5980 family protein [Actinomycetota bacterium]|nr:DUF5980 family protein [Actinomycetota bacterium]